MSSLYYLASLSRKEKSLSGFQNMKVICVIKDSDELKNQSIIRCPKDSSIRKMFDFTTTTISNGHQAAKLAPSIGLV
jgi:hypothetical protein